MPQRIPPSVIAIDLGTTTIAAQLVDPASGDVLGVETMLNPQAAFGSDVMSRIHAALEGRDLATPIRAALGEARRAPRRQPPVRNRRGPSRRQYRHAPSLLRPQRRAALSRALRIAEILASSASRHSISTGTFPLIASFASHAASAASSAPTFSPASSPPASRMAASFAALVDLGTNGEIAIGNRDVIICASTAAGPAFEAASIRMGMRAVTGAIAHVALADGAVHATVIGDVAPRGICGSGLIDAVAAGLRSGAILPNGRIANGTKLYPVAPPVVLYQADIRELQLAKGAIAAGFRLLLGRIGSSSRDLASIYLAGAFGNYVQIDSAIRIGLLEFPHSLIHAAGNTALRGAKMLLLAGEEPTLPPIAHISLAADPAFQDEFAACMTFPEK